MRPKPPRPSGRTRFSDLVVSTVATCGWAYLVYDALMYGDSGTALEILPDDALAAIGRLTESPFFWTALPTLSLPLFATVAIYHGRRWAYAVVALLALPLAIYNLVSGADLALGAVTLVIGLYSLVRLVLDTARPRRGETSLPVVQLEADE